MNLGIEQFWFLSSRIEENLAINFEEHKLFTLVHKLLAKCSKVIFTLRIFQDKEKSVEDLIVCVTKISPTLALSYP